MKEQLKDIDPSVKEPLFRRIMNDKRLSYLRENKGIVGFELNLDRAQQLSGFLLVGIQKHTVYVYRSDLNEKPRLILFPSLDKLFDTDFEMLELYVTKKIFYDANFDGKVLGTGRFDTLVADLTPPEKEVDIPDGVSEQMLDHMRKIREQGILLAQEDDMAPKVVVKQEVHKPDIQDTVSTYEDDFANDEYDSFGEGVDTDYDSNDYDDFEDEPIDDSPSIMMHEQSEIKHEVETPAEDERTIQLKAQTFTSLVEVSEFATLRLGVSKALSTQVVNKALQSNVDSSYRVELAVLLFSKLFNDKKI